MDFRSQIKAMLDFTLRGDAGDILTVAVLARSHPGTEDFWDGNWLQTEVSVRAGGFRDDVAGELRTDELAEFLERLSGLQKSLKGTAELQTMEEWLSVRLAGDGRGHVSVRCVIRDEPGIGNTLDFTLTTDQTFTQTTVAELSAVVQAYPVVGKSHE